jgi:hypothetical protein
LRPDHYDCGAARPDGIFSFSSFSSPRRKRGANVGFCVYYSEGPVGCIRSGLADDKLVAEIDRLSAEIEAIREGKEPPV